MKKIYLFWQYYNTGEYLLIATLKKENQNYIFKYKKDALKALKLGCFLPIPISSLDDINKEQSFVALPPFFSRRIIKPNKLLNEKFGIFHTYEDELTQLTYNYGRIISDNFYVISEEDYKKNSKEFPSSRLL